MDDEPTAPHERVALRWLTFGLVVAAAYVASPLAPSLFLAVWTALLAHPLLVRLDRLPGGRNVAAALVTLAVVVVIVAPSAMLLAAMVSAARGVAKSLASAGSLRAALDALMSNGAGSEGLSLIPADRGEVADLVSRYGTEVLAIGSRFAAGISRAVIDVFVYLAGVFFLLLEGEAAWRWVVAHAPLRRRHVERLGVATRETARGLLLGVGLTTAAQALVATVAYAALGVPRAWVFGPLTGLASVVPLVGSALVWVPLAVAFLLAGATSKAMVLAIIGLAVIGTIDNVLRPVFSKLGSLDLHVLVLVVAIFGGLSVLGALGALVGPLAARLALEALALYREEHLGDDA